jgi:hypothetical protein
MNGVNEKTIETVGRQAIPLGHWLCDRGVHETCRHPAAGHEERYSASDWFGHGRRGCRRGRIRSWVAGRGCLRPAPSEPCMGLSIHTAQASTKASFDTRLHHCVFQSPA